VSNKSGYKGAQKIRCSNYIRLTKTFLTYIEADNRKHAEILKVVYEDSERRKAELQKKQLKAGNKGSS
jgi:hypothetical protein